MSKTAGHVWLIFVASTVTYMVGVIGGYPLVILLSVIGAGVTLLLAIKACDQPVDHHKDTAQNELRS